MVETIFHIGAHRCATTTFQRALDRARHPLIRAGLMPWTPSVMRDTVFDPLVRQPDAIDDAGDAVVARRIAQRRAGIGPRGITRLLISEENMIGTPRDNLGRAALYPGLVPRLARFVRAFDGRVDRIGLVIRDYAAFWTSSIAFAVMAGHPVPDAVRLARIADQRRCWVDVVHDVRQVCPDVPLWVWTFDAFASRPRRQLGLLTGDPAIGAAMGRALDTATIWANRSRDADTLRTRLIRQGRLREAAVIPAAPGPWQPFDAVQRARMAAVYADDLTLLRGLNDPLLTFVDRVAIKVVSSRSRMPIADGWPFDKHG